MHIVGFNIQIYHDARSHEREIRIVQLLFDVFVLVVMFCLFGKKVDDSWLRFVFSDGLRHL